MALSDTGGSVTSNSTTPTPQSALDKGAIVDLGNQALEDAEFLRQETARIKNGLALIEFAEQMDNQKANNIASNAGAIGRIP